MDTSADPRTDFYNYAVGGWLKAHTLPKDKSRVNSFSELADRNMELLHKIAQECAADKSAKAHSYSRIVGDFYASAMDTESIEKAKFAPIEDLLQRISSVKSREDVVNLIPELHRAGVNAFFRAGPSIDQKESNTYAFYFLQGGLSLPDRDYYLDEKFAKLRADYHEHVVKMLMLNGAPDKEARKQAGMILEIETEIARSERSKVELRDPNSNYNKMNAAELASRYGTLGLTRYMNKMGGFYANGAVVGQPGFFESMNLMLRKKGIDQLKAYLHWKVLHDYAPYLHEAVQSEHFDMYGIKLRGQKEQMPRWKRAIVMVDSAIGEALGKMYVDRHFDADAAKTARSMIGDIVSVFKKRLETASWMSDSTRKLALEKLEKMNIKIGYPDKFKDYSGLVIKPDDYAGNIRRSIEFEFYCNAAKIGKPVDKTEWHMSPPTVNAYYSPVLNEIVFPAGIFQPPFFDSKIDIAVNYRKCGAVFGHELSHGFDDKGRLYDADGNLSSWWASDDEKEFKARAEIVAKLYGSQEALPNAFVNGELTLGENLADFGGVSVAYEALQARLNSDPILRKPIDGFTQEQRFFIAYAQTWIEIMTKEELTDRLLNDPHSPGKFRATLPAVNHPKFDAAFPPKDGEGAGSVQDRKIGVW